MRPVLSKPNRMEWLKLTGCIGALYLGSLVAFSSMINSNAENILLVAVGGLIVTTAAGATMCSICSPHRGHNSYAKPQDARNLYIAWGICLLSVLISTVDLAQSAYLTTLVRNEVTLGTIRGDFFQSEDFRSTTGRITGQLFIPFACLSAVLFRFTGSKAQLLLAFLVASAYSLLMGGRGQIIFFALAVLPSLLARMSLARVMGLAGALILLLGFVHEIRTPGGGQGIWLSIGQYLSTPWVGLDALIQGKHLITPPVLLRLGAPDILEKFAFPVFGNYGNLFGGLGQLLYAFGWIGALLYFFALVTVLCFAGWLCSNAPFARTGLQSLAFLYFSFFLFHDLTIFYPSFVLALFMVFLGAINLRQAKVRLVLKRCQHID